MDLVLGGKFENAIMRAIEEINNPDRVTTTHPYYLALNRRTERVFFDRLGTFSAVCNSLEILGADWTGGESDGDIVTGKMLGLLAPDHQTINEHTGQRIASAFIAANRLSSQLWTYASYTDPNDYPAHSKEEMLADQGVPIGAAESYISRLITQVHFAGIKAKLLVLDERDMAVLAEVSAFLKLHPEFDFAFPDLTTGVLDGVNFANGLLSFSPPDLVSIAAIREDADVRAYANEVRQAFLVPAATLEQEVALVRAMRRAMDRSEVLRKAEKVIETATIVAGPITYFPGIGNVVAMASDVAAATGKIAGKAADKQEWYLLSARATLVGVQDFLRRKGNL